MAFCPFCEEQTNVEKVTKYPVWHFRGEDIKVENEYFRCSKCKEEWWVEGKGLNDPYEQCYKEYEKRTGIDPRYKGE